MHLICISDLHNKLNKINLLPGDLLVISGDLTNSGTVAEYIKFNSDLDKIKKNYKFGILVIEGNHDWLGEKDPNLAKVLLTNATLLRHETIIINGVNFFGSPFTPTFHNWSFNVDRGPDIKRKWDLIPNDTDVLITHGPPYKILDGAPRGVPGYSSVEHVGCKDLLEAVFRVKPKCHIFGHIHAGHGVKEFNGITFINASSCDEYYQAVNKPIEFEL